MRDGWFTFMVCDLCCDIHVYGSFFLNCMLLYFINFSFCVCFVVWYLVRERTFG